MPEYIEREKALNDFDEWIDTTGALPKGTSYYHECRACIEDVPAADVVEVVHAYWKETTHITESKRGREIRSKLYNCSNCDAPNGRKKSSYCHWCGAKMDGKDGRII